MAGVFAERAKRSISTATPSLAANRKFGGHGPETARKVRDAEVHEGTFGQIRKTWTKWLGSIENLKGSGDPVETKYQAAISALKGIDASAKDVEKFCVLLIGHQEEEKFSSNAGLFLSALINSSSETDFTIQTKLLSEPPSFLGYRNKKNIVVEETLLELSQVGTRMSGGSIRLKCNVSTVGTTMNGGIIIVEGNVIDIAGDGMQEGKILVKGNVGNPDEQGMAHLGNHMKGGVVIVEGYVNGHVGRHMNGGIIRIMRDVTGHHYVKDGSIGSYMEAGRIEVKGSAPVMVALEMKGGEIRINGEEAEIAFDYFRGGKIVHNGKVICPN